MESVLIILLVWFLVPLGYLYLLLVASLRKLPAVDKPSNLRFAVAIAAHNEEGVIAGTLRAIRAVDYPAQLVDIYLVADHCEDETASIARQSGAQVFERNTRERDGKGPALSWLFDRIFESGQEYDAITILDADTQLDAHFFRNVGARLEAGSQAVQGNHIIRNARSGWFPALTWAMFRIDNRVHNLGRANLGFSAKNMGDSVSFRPEIIRSLCWGKGLVDDYSFRQELLLNGVRIVFEPRAIGYGQAALNWKQAISQRSRWMMGTYQANQKNARKMLKESLHKRDLTLLEGALSAYLPSYSTLSLIVGPLTAYSWLIRSGIPAWLPVAWSAALVLLIIFPLISLFLDRAPLIAFLVILTGPIYILWRTGVAFTARYIRKDVEWIRTPRQVENSMLEEITGEKQGCINSDFPSSILFLTQVIPYPIDAGPKTRAYYTMKHLARSHQVTLLSFSRPNDPKEAVDHLRDLCVDVITVPMLRSTIKDLISLVRSIFTNQPFVISRDLVPGMMRAIEEIVKANSFDYVHADQLWMVQYALHARRFTGLDGKVLRVVLDQHNAVYLIPKRMMAKTANPFLKLFLRRETRLLAQFEADVSRKCDHTVWVTAEDFEAIKQVGGDGSGHVNIIPICVDPSSVDPPGELSPHPKIFFLGGMHWPPNAEGIKWFAREVLPIIRRQLPEAQVEVVGKSPPREIRKMASVHAAGFVEDVSAYWKDSRVFIVPIHAAGGMRVKILDAWAHGLPVVSTSIGAEGIACQHGRDILIADEPAEFARCVVQLLTDDRLAECLSHAGRETLEKNYDWEKVYCSWDEIYQPAG